MMAEEHSVLTQHPTLPLAETASVFSEMLLTERLLAEKPGGMCQYKVKLTSATEVDAELVGWLRRAYDAAG